MASVNNLISIVADGTMDAKPLDGQLCAVVVSNQGAPCVPCSFYFKNGVSVAGTLAKTIGAGSSYKVLRVRGYKTGGAGGAGDTLQFKKGASAITDAISLNLADKLLVANASIDDAQNTLAPGDVLNAVTVDGGAGANDLTWEAWVDCVRV